MTNSTITKKRFPAAERFDDLHKEIVDDAAQMRVMRWLFRAAGVVLALLLVIVPLLLATDLIKAATNEWALITVSIAGALEVLFRPAEKSLQRRSDWIEMTKVRRDLEAAWEKAQTSNDAAASDRVIAAYAQKVADIWERRKTTLTEATIAQRSDKALATPQSLKAGGNPSAQPRDDEHG